MSELRWDQQSPTQISRPTKLIHEYLVRNKKWSCFKPLHFWVICYTAILTTTFSIKDLIANTNFCGCFYIKWTGPLPPRFLGIRYLSLYFWVQLYLKYWIVSIEKFHFLHLFSLFYISLSSSLFFSLWIPKTKINVCKLPRYRFI